MESVYQNMLEEGYEKRCWTIAKQVSVLLDNFGPKNNFKN